MPKLKQSFLIITMGLALAAGLSYAWTAPTDTPPNNNAPAPINVSELQQIKDGPLQVNGFRNIGSSIFDGLATFNSSIKIPTGAGPGKVLTSDAVGTASWATGGGVGGSGTPNYVSKWITNTTLGDSQIFDNGTGVGIGTSNPRNKLHIKGSHWPAVFIESTDAKGGFIGIGNNSGVGWAIGMEESNEFRIERFERLSKKTGDWMDNWDGGWGPENNSSGVSYHFNKSGFTVGGGYIAAATKYFSIKDPRYNDPGKRLIHATLEGPENSVFYRGEDSLKQGKKIIQLPDYFEALTREEGRTVLLTNIDGGDLIWVKTQDGLQVKDSKFVVVSNNNNSSQRFNWEVKAVRSDVDLLKTETIETIK